MDSNELQNGWLLSSSDGPGQALRLLIADDLLRNNYPGVSVGRHPALCERVIDEPGISHRHFRLSLNNGHLWVEDLNSLNGSQIDGLQLTPFQPAPLQAGQQLRAGRVTLSVSRIAG